MKNVTLKYGMTEATRSVPDYTTIGQLVKDDANKAFFGYGDNVNALIAGVRQSDDVVIPGGSKVVVETACNTKASK